MINTVSESLPAKCCLLSGAGNVVFSGFLELFIPKQLHDESGNNADAVRVNENSKVMGP